MASFPTSVYAPATKNSGDTIQAAHVNDLDGEVVAIEAGYRNGTAPLNSSGSTVTSLQANGPSTFAGLITASSGITIAAQGLTVSAGNTILGQSLSVAGASTFAGPITASSGITMSTGFLRWSVNLAPLSGASTRYDNVDTGNAGVLQINNNSTAIAISGFRAGANGRVLWIHNYQNSAAIRLLHENSNSSADARIIVPGGSNATLNGYESAQLVYSTHGVTGATGSRWIYLGR